MLIGVISDTHGLLRPEAVSALQGVDAILHAGDVGSPAVLDGLRTIAPVTAVRGNVDAGDWANALPYDVVATFEGRAIAMLHILEEFNMDAKPAELAAIIYGHSHKPSITRRDNTLLFNPGSAGPRRFSLPVSLGFLRVNAKPPVEAWLQTLTV